MDSGCGVFILIVVLAAIAGFIMVALFGAGVRQRSLPLKDWSNPNETMEGVEPISVTPRPGYSQNPFGFISPQMVCPHCQNKGKVRTRTISQKKGISGGKATAALLTGGVSLLATGLSRKETHTQAHCDNCGCTWVF